MEKVIVVSIFLLGGLGLGQADSSQIYCVIWPFGLSVSTLTSSCSNCYCEVVNVCPNAAFNYDAESCPSSYFTVTNDETENKISVESVGKSKSNEFPECDIRWTCPGPTILNVTGFWNNIGSNENGNQMITYTFGTSHYSEVDDINTWSQSVTESISLGFGVVSGEVASQTTQTVSETNKNVFTTNETSSYQYEFGPGSVWQWTWKTVDTDGTSLSTTMDIVITPGQYVPPCCIPGYFNNISNASIPSCAADTDGDTYILC